MSAPGDGGPWESLVLCYHPRVFHPIVQDWFDRAYGVPTPCQLKAWPVLKQGRGVLVAAPTGSGKTLAAFLSAIDDLVRELLAEGALPDETRILYVSPLKALSNDVEKNLREPLGAINRALEGLGVACPLTAAVRSGDTPASERDRMKRRPPHILVTTPESLFILLTSESGRRMLATVRSVIVDEIHALAPNKRGAHLSLSLERLARLTDRPPLRLGLSATQRPLERVAAFLAGRDGERVQIVDGGLQRHRDLAIVLPASPLQAVMSAEVWGEVYRVLASLAREHATTLIFVNTRRHAERVAKRLAEMLGERAVTAHHGSLSREHRLDAETRLKNGELKALVATTSLELGIDIGDVELVCQLGSPRSVSVFLQRVGRSGHGLGKTPKGRLFPLSRDDLVECTALMRCCAEGRLDEIRVPPHPLDVLAQQIVAETASRASSFDELYEMVRRAHPYASLERARFDDVVRMLAEGFSTRRGRRGALLHVDLVNRVVSARKGARLTALTNGGAIPDLFDYDVVLEPEGVFVGTLNEDFAFESLAGDVFQLGNASYRILRVEKGVVRVADARGQPPNIPFWFGEAPGRGDTLSRMVGRLREDVERWMDEDPASVPALIAARYAVDHAAAAQVTAYLGAAWEALGEILPTQRRIVAERFFDEVGDMHLVLHAPFGSRVNRAFGLALRKRFCRRFNFELQAAALEDCVVLSLGETHGFDLEEVAGYLSPDSARRVLTQALFDAPVFPTHWRWVANVALAVKRFRNGRKTPAQFQRADAEDLIAVVFPEQLACLENVHGEREAPDHPLVNQTLWDCLHEVMDVAGLERMLEGLGSGSIEWVARDLVTPSPLAEEVLSARPYAFLDDAPAEERRTLAVQTRGIGPRVEEHADYSQLDPDAVRRVRAEAWPRADGPDELHDALVCGGFLTETEMRSVCRAATVARELVRDARATRVGLPGGALLWVAAERLDQLCAVWPGSPMTPPIAAARWRGDGRWTREEALAELVKSRLEILGPVTAREVADSLGLEPPAAASVLERLVASGFAVAGRFDERAGAGQWCDRRLVARIHRYTLKRLRARIEPVSLAAFMRFLFKWQHLDGVSRVEGVDGVAEVVSQLEGFDAPLKLWESEILPARVHAYTPALLDQIGLSGRVLWRRALNRPKRSHAARHASHNVAAVPVAFYARDAVEHWRFAEQRRARPLSATAARLAERLAERGPCFYDDLMDRERMLPAQLENALAELVGEGMVTCDGFNGLRALMVPASRRPAPARTLQRRGRRLSSRRIEQSGRWSLVAERCGARAVALDDAQLQYVCEALLHRYGVVSRAVFDHERTLPPWRLFLPLLRRMEARGEVRGGRFVAALSGEQYALPEAVEALRGQRDEPDAERYVRVHAADPLNLSGGILPVERVGGNRSLLFRNGSLAATGEGVDIDMVGAPSAERQWTIRERFLATVGRGYNGRLAGRGLSN